MTGSYEETKKGNDSQTFPSRWQFREILRSCDYQDQTVVRLSLFYSQLSIGPVLAIAVTQNLPQTRTVFYSVELLPLIAAYIQHILTWSLTLRNNQNVGESGIYNKLTDEEKIVGTWSPHFSFLVNGESAAIETKLQIRKILDIEPNSLRNESFRFLRPLTNDPTEKRYVTPNNRGKRGKFDPGPVFGMSFDFLKSEAESQKFFNE